MEQKIQSYKMNITLFLFWFTSFLIQTKNELFLIKFSQMQNLHSLYLENTNDNRFVEIPIDIKDYEDNYHSKDFEMVHVTDDT